MSQIKNNKSSTGTLYLIPTIISPGTQHRVLPSQVKDILPEIRHFLAEDIRTARRFLSSLKVHASIEDLHFDVLNKDTPDAALPGLMKPLHEGKHVGVLSESGCPGIADPGARAVNFAHRHHFTVVPLVGPSSILLALMASGLNGQQFAFHGYLPVKEKELVPKILELERESKAKNQTQIFIETPYRNNSLFQQLMKILHEETLLTIAVDITGERESILTCRIGDWKKQRKEWPKLPAVFLLLA